MTKKERARKKFEEVYKPAYAAFIKLYPFTTESLEGEIWLPIPYCDDYHCSNFGRIKSFKYNTPRIMTPSLNGNGYLFVCLCKNGKQKLLRIHVLVGKLFIPNPENKPEVNHVYSRFSNHVDCLEWATGKENMEHAFTTGLCKSGEENILSKLTNEQVFYIRENPDGLNLEQLAEMFGVTATTISNIQLGKTYRNAEGSIRGKIDNRIPDEMREQILADYQPGVHGHGAPAVAKKFGVGHTAVWNIVNGK